jgi:alpha-mannosidase
MDEFLCSPETIMRNMRQGLATAQRLGIRPRIGYIPDSFGHVAQMPQILALAGMEAGLVWRGVPFAVNRTVFTWEAPDGTRLPAMYLATSYSNGATLPGSFEELMVRAKRIVADMEPFGPEGIVLAMCGSDHLGPQAHLPALFAEANASQDDIEFRIGSLAQYFASLPEGPRPEWRGEMRSSARANVLMGVLSARMPLKQAEFAASAALERYAEPLCVLSGFDPGAMLDECWRSMVENSAHDSVCGCGIDAVAADVLARYERAARVATLVADGALTRLADQMRIAGDGDGLLIFNPSPFERGGPAEATVTIPTHADLVRFGEDAALQALEETEQLVVDMTVTGAQLAKIVPTIHSRQMGTLYVNRMELVPGRVRTVKLELGPVPAGHFDVEGSKREVEAAALAAPRAPFRVLGAGPPLVRMLIDVPPLPGLGWTTLFPRVADEPPRPRVTTADGAIDNGLVRVETTDGSTVTLTDLATGTRYEGVGLTDGADAGDEYTYAPPQKDSLVVAPVRAHVAADAGPLQATLTLTQAWRIPEAIEPSRKRRARKTVEMPVRVEWAVRAGEPFARVTIEATNTAKDHRLRLRVPLPFAVNGSDADGAFAVERRGLTGEGDHHEVPTPTSPCRRWVDVSDGSNGIAALHQGTPEYEVTHEGRALQITLLRCVGWLSRQDCSTRSGPAGPMLPAPGAQLPGRHRFALALYPHTGSWEAADVARVAERFVYPMRAVVVRERPEGTIAARDAALSISPDTVQLSALERVAGRVEVRVFNASSAPVEARLTFGATITPSRAAKVRLTGEELEPLATDGSTVLVPLRGHEIATVALG